MLLLSTAHFPAKTPSLGLGAGVGRRSVLVKVGPTRNFMTLCRWAGINPSLFFQAQGIRSKMTSITHPSLSDPAGADVREGARTSAPHSFKGNTTLENAAEQSISGISEEDIRLHRYQQDALPPRCCVSSGSSHPGRTHWTESTRAASCQEQEGNDQPLWDKRTEWAACVGPARLIGDEIAVCVTEWVI